MTEIKPTERFSAGDVIRCAENELTVIEWYRQESLTDDYIVEADGNKMIFRWYRTDVTGRQEREERYKELRHFSKQFSAMNQECISFLTPENITEWFRDSFGYTLPYRHEGYFELYEYLHGNVTFPSLRTALTAAINVILAFRIIHNDGFVFAEMNDSVFLFNKENGKVAIRSEYITCSGVPTFVPLSKEFTDPTQCDKQGNSMMRNPDLYSDRYIMAVLIFMLLFMKAPMDTGTHRHFIMEEADQNLQDDAYIIWEHLPAHMKEIFLNCFGSASSYEVRKQLTGIVWLRHLFRFKNEITRCQCGTEVFIDQEDTVVCPACGRQINIPYRLMVKEQSYSIPCLHRNTIYGIHIGDKNNPLELVGTIVARKSEPDVLGIRNETDYFWVAITRGSIMKKLSSGSAVPLKSIRALMIRHEYIMVRNTGK